MSSIFVSLLLLQFSFCDAQLFSSVLAVLMVGLELQCVLELLAVHFEMVPALLLLEPGFAVDLVLDEAELALVL